MSILFDTAEIGEVYERVAHDASSIASFVFTINLQLAPPRQGKTLSQAG